VLDALRERTDLDTSRVDDVILGCVMPVGEQGANVARVGAMEAGWLAGERLRPERESAPRYYYSAYDHEISPAWSPDGDELLFVSNPDVAWGSGGIWRIPLAPGSEAVLVRDEETTWKAKPDWSPDGKRVTWSSYHGRQWHQLWITTSRGGGDPLPLSYGDFDIMAARWSPDGRYIGFISNQSGNTALWLQESVGGARRQVIARQREYLRPMGELDLRVVDSSGGAVAARVSVTGSDGRSYAPDPAWIHADDGFDRRQAVVEQHYFHSPGESRIRLPAGEARITVWRGLENAIARGTIDIPASGEVSLELQSLPLGIPDGWQNQWISGDVHVHMNYGGAYRNTPERLVSQARAEDLDVVFNLVVNKEQRIPDIDYFSTEPDKASDPDVSLLHGQEFHTGYWGHLGLLGLADHLLIPDYSAYPNTGMASPFPDNNTVADLAHRQQALVGWVHPYDKAPDPEHDAVLTNALPIAVALGKVDYYEVSGFADYRETQQVWYRLLNCGFRLAAAGGTDAMANYASLRGPVGLNRVYVLTEPGAGNDAERRDHWLQALKAGASMATNGPILSFELAGQPPGGELRLPEGGHRLTFRGFMQSIVPVDHLEVVVNGKVVQTIRLDQGGRSGTFDSEITLDQSGWVLLRAWNEDASPDIFDRFPYATTNPVFVEIGGQPVRSKTDADYFIRWIERVRDRTLADPDYNTEAERRAVLSSIDAALKLFTEGNRP